MRRIPVDSSPADLALLRDRIDAAGRRSEAACIHDLLAAADPAHASSPAILHHADAIAAQARRHRPALSLAALAACYPLSSPQGLALLGLAEALPRIPDAPTAALLVADKLGGRGRGRDWSTRAMSGRGWPARMLPGLLTRSADLLDRGALSDTVVAGARVAVKAVANQFVFAATLPDALARADEEHKGYRYSFDMLGEAAQTQEEADVCLAAIESAIHAIGTHAIRGGRDGVSVKLSALHPRYAMAQRERVLRELLPRLERLVALARGYGIGLTIDAEEADRIELSLDLVSALVRRSLLGDYSGFGMAVQAYQKRCPQVIDYLVGLARDAGVRLSLRLVKGAYWDSEIKQAQVSGLADYPVFTCKAHTDLSWLVCAQQLMQAHDAVVPQFATHHAHAIATVLAWARARHLIDMEFQCLHGMGEPLYDALVDTGVPCRVYAPVGPQATLLPYLVRRLLENGANTSFLHQLASAGPDLAPLLRDPFAEAQAEGGAPDPRLPLPQALYGAARRNAVGDDLASPRVIARMLAAIRQSRSHPAQSAPILHAVPLHDGVRELRADETGRTTFGDEPANPHDHATPDRPLRAIVNPADPSDLVGHACDATGQEVTFALQAASEESAWRSAAPNDRAAVLDAAAESLAQGRDRWIALLVREAGKCIPAAIAEAREAEDALRYAAAQVRALHESSGEERAAAPLGIVVCISPWNFPLAIFVGQIAAALAAGNAVLAKPAEQTPLIAAEAVRTLHAAGIPTSALQLVPGTGETVGRRLVADPRVAGVLFTGSTAVAHAIARSLLDRPQPSTVRPVFVAETGGQNAMIVDSTALPEQVVADVLASAFDSAGQRCSALRLLCLQEDIAEAVLMRLRGAMRECVVGNPAALSTDVGPVIDDEAARRLRAYVAGFRHRGRVLAEAPLPPLARAIAPVLLRVDRPSDLQGEVFGPVLHVLRFPAARLETLLEEIQASGYGLTMGLHTRLDGRIAAIVAAARVGNLYVNRNMIGAVVGVQPFGGEGRSGTGPKAGGPFLLPTLQRHASNRALHRLLGCLTTDVTLPLQGDSGEAADATVAADDALRHARRQLGALEAWCGAHEAEGRAMGGACAARCREYASTTPLGQVFRLPGPTGESNQLRLVPRGRIACCMGQVATLIHAIAAIAATGNLAVLDRRSHDMLPSGLPDVLMDGIDVIPVDDLLAHHGWLAASQAPFLLVDDLRAADLRAWPADAWPDDAPVPQILGVTADSLPLWRLMHERSVCINTAAVGGNAALIDATTRQ